MKLITWNGNLSLGECCAKPGHQVREASPADVAKWAKERDMYLMSNSTQKAVAACMCQSSCGCL